MESRIPSQLPLGGPGDKAAELVSVRVKRINLTGTQVAGQHYQFSTYMWSCSGRYIAVPEVRCPLQESKCRAQDRK